MFSRHRGILLAANIAPRIRIHDPVVWFKRNDCGYSLQNFQLRETFSIRMEYNVVTVKPFFANIILLNTNRSYLKLRRYLTDTINIEIRFEDPKFPANYRSARTLSRDISDRCSSCTRAT